MTNDDQFLTRDDIVEHYATRSGLDVTALPWYMALALWKAAIFSEAIYTRWLAGERPGDDTFGPSLETGVLTLLDEAEKLLVELP